MSERNLKDMLLSERSRRVEEVVVQRTRSIAVVLEDLEDPHNIAAVLRSCEAFGIQEVHAITRRFTFHPNPKITQGAEKWLDLSLYREAGSCLRLLKQRGYLLAATDLSESSTSLFELPIDRPLAIVFGTEKVGVTREVLDQCDVRFKIPMLGFSQSFNISVAAAVCLSHLVFKRLEKHGRSGDLPEAEQAAMRERFFSLAIKQRHRMFKENPARHGPSKALPTALKDPK
ncbi:MAG: RNA methyltransferase [Deltaproteobacteria bacterium]|nr:RNA methyltransferase [Deltaproteobacteria bacterium]